MNRKRIEGIIEKARDIGFCPFVYNRTFCSFDANTGEMILGIRLEESMMTNVQSSVEHSGIKQNKAIVQSDDCL